MVSAPSSAGEERPSSYPASVPLSKSGETHVPVTAPLHQLLSLHVFWLLLCVRRRSHYVVQYSRSLFGELARGSRILTEQLWHQSKQSYTVQWQEQVVIVSHSEKYCRLHCDIVPKNGSFNSASFLKPRPTYHSHFFLAAALITYITICWMYFEPKPLKVSVKEKLHNVLKNDICVDTWCFSTKKFNYMLTISVISPFGGNMSCKHIILITS